MKYLASIIALALMDGSALADSWNEFMDRRVVDSSGTHYVVLTKAKGWEDDPGRGGPVSYTIAERQGALAVRPATDRIDYEEFRLIEDANVKVRDGDTITGKGMLDRAPLEVHMSSEGIGFVTLDVHGYNYSDASSKNALIYVSRNGEIGFRKSLEGLFHKEEIPLFTPTAGGTFWLRASWLDDRNAQVIVVGRAYANQNAAILDEGAKRYLFRAVSIPSGRVTPVDQTVVTECLKQRDPNYLSSAISLAVELHLPNLGPMMKAIVEDQKMPTSIQKQALAVYQSEPVTEQKGAPSHEIEWNDDGQSLDANG